MSDEDRKHHPFSPSSLALREACECYSPSSGDSKASRDGTLQHLAVELEEDIDSLTDRQAEAVAQCIDFCDELGERRYGGKFLLFKEQYFPIDKNCIVLWKENPKKRGKRVAEKHEGTTAGYADRVYVDPEFRFADVVDWKFGRFEVKDAKSNIQGISYALGTLEKFPKLPEVTVHFISPHRDEWSFHTFTRADLDWMYVRVQRAVRRSIRGANSDFEKATPDASACLFCSNFLDCPALAKKVLELGAELTPLELPKEIRPLRMKDPKDMATGIQLAAVVKRWAEHFRTTASHMALEHDLVPEGYTLVPMQTRQVVSLRGVREAAIKFGLTNDEVDAAQEIHLGAIEEFIQSKKPRGQKGPAVKEFAEILDSAGYTEYGPVIATLRMKKGTTTKENKDNG